jgi:hypothetical protein
MEHPEKGTNKHCRRADAVELGQFAFENDIPLIEIADDPTHGDVMAIEARGGFIPFLLCVDGTAEEVYHSVHVLFHEVEAGVLNVGWERLGELHDNDSPVLDGPRPPVLPDGGHSWDSADFANPEHDVYPAAWLAAEQWMGHVEKQPFAPWADRDHPDCPPDEDARWKWGLTENYTDGETIAIAEDDHRLDGRAFLQQTDDPNAYVDGDNVRCPEGGDVHPTFLGLIGRLGLSYADISISDRGVHVPYLGELPEGVKQADWQLDDEPWGTNDEPPTIEIYDRKRVCVATGKHVPGTPLDVRPWDDDALEAILDEHVPDADRHTQASHDTDADPLEDYEPTVTDAHETTGEIRDVYAAIDALRPADLPLRTSKVGEESGPDGWEKWDPSSYRSSSGGDSLHRPSGESKFYDQKTGHAFGLLALFAAEQDVISKPWHDLSGATWFEAVDAARDAGAPIPVFGGDTGGVANGDEGVAVLPTSPIARAAANGWIWQQADRDGDTVTDARHRLYDRTTETIATAMDKRESAVIDAIMGGGKTYGYFAAGVERDRSLAYFSPREDLYKQAVEYATENGIERHECYILPSINRDCPTFAGEHGDSWQNRVRTLYDRGVTPKTIHSLLGDEIPCKNDGKCSYEHRCEFDPDDFEVLIGHHKHAHLPQVTKGRQCAFDEDPTNAFTTRVAGSALTRGVNAFFSLSDSPPFDSFTDLIENRRDPDRREAGLEWFETGNSGRGFDFEPDERNTIDFEDRGYHAYAPHAVYVILSAEPIEPGYSFERTTIPDMNDDKPATGLFFTTSEQEGDFFVELQTAPDLTYANSVLALDGTPLIHPETGRPAEWDGALGRSMRHRQVLDDVERSAYLREQGYVFVQSSPFVRPYSSGRYNDAKRDAALLASVRDVYGDGESPVVFTSKAVEDEYRAGGFIERGLASEIDHTGALRGSNAYADERLLVHLGSSHHGDHELRRRVAMLGEAVASPEGKGIDRSYGDLGDAVLAQMREHQTAQNVLRVGRDGRGALVVLDTCVYPDYLPVDEAMRGGDVSLWSAGERQVHRAWCGLDGERRRNGVAATGIAARSDVEIGERQVRRVLDRLATKGHLDRRDDPGDGRRSLWVEDGLGEIDSEGCAEIDLPDIDMDAIGAVRDERDVPAFARRWEGMDISSITHYTQNVRSSPAGSTETEEPPPSLASEGGLTTADHPDPPPDEAD